MWSRFHLQGSSLSHHRQRVCPSMGILGGRRVARCPRGETSVEQTAARRILQPRYNHEVSYESTFASSLRRFARTRDAPIHPFARPLPTRRPGRCIVCCLAAFVSIPAEPHPTHCGRRGRLPPRPWWKRSRPRPVCKRRGGGKDKRKRRTRARPGCWSDRWAHLSRIHGQALREAGEVVTVGIRPRPHHVHRQLAQ